MQRFELKSLDRARLAFGSIQPSAGIGPCGAHGFCTRQASVLMPEPKRSGEEKSPLRRSRSGPVQGRKRA